MASSSSPSSFSSPALLLDQTGEGVSEVILHPLVFLSVLDHHTRRQEATGRVIGTLLGRRDGEKIEVTNCFAVPHAERGDEVAIGKDFNKQMLGLHLRANRKEVVVGWYSSASSSMPLIADTSSLIHDFYAAETEDGDPIHLVVDTRLQRDVLSLRAFRSTPVLVQGEPLANLFHEVRLSLQSNEPEAICLDQMIQQTQKRSNDDDNNNSNTTTPASTNVDNSAAALQGSMEKLLGLLDTASKHVDQVVDGQAEADATVGRQIADALTSVPRIRPEVFDRLFHDSLQDLLMVTYLSNITKTQVTIAEKLNASLGV